MEAKKPARKTTKPAPKKSEHVEMRRDDGKTANVHKSMIDEYRKGGYELRGN